MENNSPLCAYICYNDALKPETLTKAVFHLHTYTPIVKGCWLADCLVGCLVAWLVEKQNHYVFKAEFRFLRQPQPLKL